jgi:hypothetical protein
MNPEQKASTFPQEMVALPRNYHYFCAEQEFFGLDFLPLTSLLSNGSPLVGKSSLSSMRLGPRNYQSVFEGREISNALPILTDNHLERVVTGKSNSLDNDNTTY